MRLVSLAPFAIDPPQLGGQVVIRHLNAALAAGGHSLEQFCAGIRWGDLAYLGRERRLVVMPGYREWRRTEPLSVAGFVLAAAAGLPPLWAGSSLARRPWRALRSALDQCDAVLLHMPWCFHPKAIQLPPSVPLVYLAQNAEFELAQAWPSRWDRLGRRLAAWAEDQERRVLERADLICPITAGDADTLVAHYGLARARMAVLPVGIDVAPLPTADAPVRASLRRTLGLGDEFVVVLAASKHPPNVEAARHALRIAEELPAEMSVIIAGSVAQQLKAGRRARARLVPGDPAPFLQAADAAINPMCSGSGMNVKMLNYLGAGLPVVTTPFGARGVAGKSGEHFLVAGIGEFPAALRALAEDRELCAALGRAGHALVLEHYSSTASAARLLALLSEARAGQRV